MSELEKKITNRLKDATSTGRVNPDELWARVEEEIDDAPTSPTGLSWRKGLLGLLLLLPLVGLWYALSPAQEASVKAMSEFAIFQIEATGQQLATDDGAFNFELCYSEQATIGGTESSQSKMPASFAPIAIVADPLQLSLGREFPQGTPNKNWGVNTKEQLFSQTEKPLLKPEEEVVLDQFFAGSARGIARLSPKPLALLPLAEDNPPFPLPRPSFLGTNWPEADKETSFKKQSVQGLSLGGFFGINTVKARFQSSGSGDVDGERTALLNDGYQLEPGLSVALELNYQPSERLLLSTGFQYNRFLEEFNYRSDVDTMITVTNGLDSSRLNAISTRIVVHHNRHQSITIPLLLGLQFGKGKFQYGAQAGIGLNLLLTQSGRLLNAEGKLADYDQSDALLPRAKIGLSYLIQPFLSYQLSDHLSLISRARLNYTNYGERPLFDLKMQSWATGFDLGMRWRF